MFAVLAGRGGIHIDAHGGLCVGAQLHAELLVHQPGGGQFLGAHLAMGHLSSAVGGQAAGVDQVDEVVEAATVELQVVSADGGKIHPVGVGPAHGGDEAGDRGEDGGGIAVGDHEAGIVEHLHQGG